MPAFRDWTSADFAEAYPTLAHTHPDLIAALGEHARRVRTNQIQHLGWLDTATLWGFDPKHAAREQQADDALAEHLQQLAF